MMVSAAGDQVQANIRRHAESSERLEHRGQVRKMGAGLLLLGAASALGLARRASVRQRASGGRMIRQHVSDAAGGLGRGILSGMVGTLAITTASTIDQLVTEAIHARKEKRVANLDLDKAITSPWSFSAGVVSKVFGISSKDAKHERRLSIMAHWGYGSSWGLTLALLHAFGVRGIGAMGAVLAGQLGAETVAMPAFGLFASPTQWGRRAIVSSVYQHMTYALAAVVAFEWLQPQAERATARIAD